MSIVDMKMPSVSEESNSWVSRVWEMGKKAEDRLRHSAYLELRNVTCEFHEGVLTLRGCVPSYYLKQLAQSLLFEQEGVLELNNQLNVIMPINVRQPDCVPENNCDPSYHRYV